MNTIPIDKVVNEATIAPFHRLVFLLCAVLMIVDGYDMISYGSVVARLMLEWELSSVQAGWLGSVALFGMIIGGMFIAPLADKFGRRPVMLACLAASAAASLGCALSTGFVSLAIFRTLVGISLGAMVPNFIALVGEYAPKRSKAFLICMVCSLYSAGGIAAGLLAIVLIPNFGWRSVFFVSAAAVVLVPLMFKLLPESPEFLARQPHRRQEFEGIVARIAPGIDPTRVVSVVRETVPKAPIAEIFRHGNTINTILIWIVFATTMLLSYGLNTWLPTLMATAGYPLGSGLFNLVILNVGGLFGAMFAGWLSDRFGIKRIILCYFLLATVSLTCLGSNPSALVLNILLMVAGATTIGTLSVVHALAAEYYPSLVRSTGIGWAAGVGRIGAMCGPILGGALLGLALPFQQNFIIVALPGLLGVLAIACVRMSRSASVHHSPTDGTPEQRSTDTDNATDVIARPAG